jgi:hypothetical protein
MSIEATIEQRLRWLGQTKIIEYFQVQSVPPHDLLVFGGRAVLWTVLAALVLWFAESRWRFVGQFISEKRTPLDLAIFRAALMVTYLETVHDLPKIRRFAALDSALIVPPVGWGHLAFLIPRNIELVEMAGGLLIVCIILVLVGLWTRISIVGAVLTSLYLLTILQIFGKVNHSHMLVLFGVLLCASPCGDALSIDSYLHRRRGNGIPALAASRRYGGPLQSVTLIIGLIYFFPGIWKISRAGLNWFTAVNLRNLIARKLLESSPSQFQSWVLHHPIVLVLGASCTIVFEVGWIFAVMNRRTRPLALAAGLAFHTFTRLTMNISFWTLQVSYVALLDWGAVGGYFSPRIRKARLVTQAWVEARGDNWAESGLGRPFTMLATALIAGMVVTGVAHRVSAWPIACYPTFDELPPLVSPLVIMQARATDGRIYRDTLSYDPVLQGPYGSERYQGMMAAVGCPGKLYNDARARAIVRIWEAAYHHPDIISAEIYCDTYGSSKAQLLEHHMLGSVSMTTAKTR